MVALRRKFLAVATSLNGRSRRRIARCMMAATSALAVLFASFAGETIPRAYAELRTTHGEALSGLLTANVDPSEQALSIRSDLHRQDGLESFTMTASGIPWGLTFSYHYPATPRLEPGVYDVIVQGDRRHRSFVHLGWPSSGAVTQYTLPEPSTELVAPLIRVEAFGHRSLITVQNTDSDEVEFELALFAADRSGIAASARFKVAGQVSKTIDATRDPALSAFRSAFPTGFVGSARIRSLGAPLTAHILTEGEPGAMGVYDYVVPAAESSASTIHIPRFRNAEPHAFRSPRSTLVAVANPSDRAITVRVRYSGVTEACAGAVMSTTPRTIPPWSTTVFDTVMDGDVPGGCAGHATVSGDGPLSAIVVTADGVTGHGARYSAHRAITERMASTRVLLPNVRNAYIAGLLLTSEILVTNPGERAALIELLLIDPGSRAPLPCTVCTLSVDSGQSLRIDLGDLGVETDWYGTMRIDSDEPITAVHHLVSITGAQDEAASIGWPMKPTLGEPTPSIPTKDHTEYLPLYLRDAKIFEPFGLVPPLFFPVARNDP